MTLDLKDINKFLTTSLRLHVFAGIDHFIAINPVVHKFFGLRLNLLARRHISGKLKSITSTVKCIDRTDMLVTC